MTEFRNIKPYIWDLFPDDYLLVRASKDGFFVKENQWGLVRLGAIEVVWSTNPIKDPLKSLSDETLMNLMSNDPLVKLEGIFSQQLKLFKNEFLMSPQLGYDLIEMSKRNGFDPSGAGYAGDFAYWIFDHMANIIATNKARII